MRCAQYKRTKREEKSTKVAVKVRKKWLHVWFNNKMVTSPEHIVSSHSLSLSYGLPPKSTAYFLYATCVRKHSNRKQLRMSDY